MQFIQKMLQAGGYKPQMLVQPATSTSLGQTAHNCGPNQIPAEMYHYERDLTFSPEYTNLDKWRLEYNDWFSFNPLSQDPTRLQIYRFEDYLLDRGCTGI